MEAGSIPFRFVLEEVDKGILTTTTVTAKVDEASEEFHDWRYCCCHDQTAPRGSWIMGRVTKTYPDKKGLVRAVQLKTKTGNLERPIYCFKKQSKGPMCSGGS